MTMTPDEKAALSRVRDAQTLDDRYSAIIAIGKSFKKTLAPAVAEYLHDPEPDLRSAAIRTLGFYWQLPAYREVAEQMMREDPDDETRGIAVLAWAAYDTATRSPSTLRRLYQLVVDDTQPDAVRAIAYTEFFTVYLPNAVDRPKPASSLDRPLEDGILWTRLDAVMRETGADRGTEADLVRTTRIETRDALTTVSLTHDAFEVHCADKVWRGTVVPGTWDRAVGAMELAGFPGPPAPRAGEAIIIGCTRDGNRAELEAPIASTRYRDIVRLTGQIGGDLVPELGAAGPERLVSDVRESRS